MNTRQSSKIKILFKIGEVSKNFGKLEEIHKVYKPIIYSIKYDDSKWNFNDS